MRRVRSMFLTMGHVMRVAAGLLVLSVVFSVGISAQQSVPALVQFSGQLRDQDGKPLSGVQGVTFALYKDQSGGASLWMETQNVTADSDGRFVALLGASSEKGLPIDLFSTGQAQWLGMQAAGYAEQPRSFLTSVPYALATPSVLSSDSKIVESSKASSTGTAAAAAAPGGVPIFSVVTDLRSGLQSDNDGAGTVTLSLIKTCSPGQLLKWDGSAWGCTADFVDDGTNVRIRTNIVLPDTNGSGTAGVIKLGTAPFLHNFGSNNTFVGVSGNFAMTGFSNTATGASALAANTTGSDNTAAGGSALAANTTGGDNTAAGAAALKGNTTGSDNTAAGGSALAANTTGDNNTGLGFNAGVNAGGGNTTGSRNTFIGANAQPGTGSLINATAIGADAVVSANNSLVLGSSGVKVGIGTSIPTQPLEVIGNVKADGLCIGTDCRGAWPAGGGTITGVTTAPGSGLTGGATSGNVNLSIPTNGVTNAMLQNNSVTVNTGTGLSGGGPVALGGTLTITNTLTTDLNNEIARATAAESTLTTNLNNEAAARVAADAALLPTAGGTMTGKLAMGASGPAGDPSVPIEMLALSLQSATPINQVFQLRTDVLNNNTNDASGRVSLLYAEGTNPPAGTGIHFRSDGKIEGDGSLLTNLASATIADGSITNAKLQNSSVTITPGTGLSGGGLVALGSSVTLSNGGVTALTSPAGGGLTTSGATGNISLGLRTDCGPGQLLKFISGVWVCAADDTSVGGPFALLNAANSFTAEQSIDAASPGIALSVTSTAATGPSEGVYGASTSDQGIGVVGRATSGSGTTFGGFFQNYSKTGGSVGVRGEVSNSPANSFGVDGHGGIGVHGISAVDGMSGQLIPISGVGVQGLATFATGTTYGGWFQSFSSSGVGVQGSATVAGNTTGVQGISTNGRGVYGQALGTTGINYGVYGQTSNPTGFGVYSQGNLHVAGNITYTGTISQSSSRRWKTNIAPMSGALEKVERLQGVTYDWKESGRHDIGLIAEEVRLVVPEVVVMEENGVDAKGVDYARLTSLLIEAVKEQQSQIRKEQDELRELKAEMQRLHSQLKLAAEQLRAGRSEGSRTPTAASPLRSVAECMKVLAVRPLK